MTDAAQKLNEVGLRFLHVGVAVLAQSSARRFLEALGYQAGSEQYEHEQNVNISMYAHVDFPCIEVVSPGKGGGPVSTIVEQHKSGVAYHLAFTTENLEESLRLMDEV